jgi:hypothetical protein
VAEGDQSGGGVSHRSALMPLVASTLSGNTLRGKLRFDGISPEAKA